MVLTIKERWTTFTKMRRHHRPAERSSITIVAQRISWLSGRIQEQIIRGKNVVADKLIQRPVKFISAALKTHIDHGAGGVTFLRVKTHRYDFEFLHRICRRNESNARFFALGVRRSIESEFISARSARRDN